MAGQDRPDQRRREKRWRGTDRLERRHRPAGSTLVALLLACATLITLDAGSGEDSPVDPARHVVAEVLGPAEATVATLARPFTAVPQWFRSHASLQQDVARLEAENARLRGQVRTAGVDSHRLAEYDALTSSAEDLGHALVPARVIGYGPAQSFSQTVTIDAGTDAGVHPDMTVLNNDGLVGRVLRSTSSTATVLLLVDAESVVGGRVDDSMEIGFLRGRGSIHEGTRLDLELLDREVVPGSGDTVVTWGSKGGAPYLPGVPIGSVEQVLSSPRESTRRAVIDPYVDFSSLDLVGVVVPSGTTSDRGVIEADGSVR